MKRRLFRDRLKKGLKNPGFKRAFEAEDLPARLALRIAELRQKEGLSQADLAKRLGAKQQLIARIESLDHTNMTLSTLQKIAWALHRRLVVDLR
ncbi:MAG TPA: helix-turn-helix domain-containing protein [Nitrospiria bacterium]|nr:helix-turn-helix domain-containing protein [Nitrospiria bacterium]